MEIRTLQAREREALFELLDGWATEGEFSGGPFFRRYVEDDPAFEDQNYWLAVEGGKPVSCVQIFPHQLRLAGASVSMGGIGSVFTRADCRKRGLAEGLLARACEAMVRRGMSVSMLFAVRIPWYTKLGWRSWGMQRTVLSREVGAAAPVAALPFEPSRDLAEVVALHEAFCSARHGSALRGPVSWEASLANAGNPAEEFVVSRSADGVRAYARAAAVEGFLSVMEFAHAPGAEADLAALVAAILTPRPGDALALPNKPSDSLRAMAATVCLDGEPALAAALRAAGVGLRTVSDPTLMLRCLDAGLLAEQSGVPLERGESGEALLARVLPAESLAFWPSDRF